MVGINLGGTSKLCSTKTRGNGARFEAMLLVKIHKAQIQKRSRIVEINVETHAGGRLRVATHAGGLLCEARLKKRFYINGIIRDLENILTGISQGSFDKIYLRDASGNMVDLLTLLGSLGSVTDVISNSSELVVTSSGTTKILTLNLGGYVTSTALTNALAAYTDTTTLTIFLGAKQNTLTAGTGIAISGATISSTHTPIILQLDGTELLKDIIDLWSRPGLEHT